MKSVIVVAYHFPPDGSAGAHRPLRFVRQLPSAGWAPAVVTLATNFYERYDSKLLDLLPPEIILIRVRNPDPWKRFQQWRAKRIERKTVTSGDSDLQIQVAHPTIRSKVRKLVRVAESWCYHPDMAMGWIRPAVKALGTLCAEHCPDVIYATGGPWSSFIVAQRTSTQTRVPYVLDFRDSWTLAYNDFESFRPSWAIRRDHRSLCKLFTGAQAVIFRYHSEAECYWRIYKKALDPFRVHVIPNGYNGELDEFASPEANQCTILYAGTLPPYRYDTLLQALQELKKSEPQHAARLRLLFVGDGMETLVHEAVAAGVANIIEIQATVPYTTVERLQKNSHALLLLGVKPGKGYELCGSKVFSYLKANRPIFAIVSPADEMRKVLSRVGISTTVADPDVPSEIVVVLKRIIDAWSAGKMSLLLPDPFACRFYSAERQAAALVKALEGASAMDPFVPGVAEIPPSLEKAIASSE
jgi:glycosyltransferase involved in cell wall biosynthesis